MNITKKHVAVLHQCYHVTVKLFSSDEYVYSMIILTLKRLN